ncbi:TetR/AcrR family transcriptional regulator [bacterium]|nr:TetR/AcrR family transcriptional regulator [bacterium]
MSEKYHKSTFEKIPEEKQLKILRIAAGELATKGLSNARIKEIAEKAGISYGSMYNYFSTKDDLIRTIILEGVEFQNQVFAEGEKTKGDVFQKIETVIQLAMEYSQKYPEMIAIWLEVSHGYNERFIKDSLELERDGVLYWRGLVQNGIREGLVDPSTDANSAAFCINSIVGQLMKSYISDFHKNILSLFFPDSKSCSIDEILPGVMKSIKALLGCRS